MDPQVGGSFIPKKPLVESRRGGMGGIFFSISLLVFLLSLGAAGAAFAYQQYLNAAIASKDESLKRTEEAFDAESIETLVRTDRRIKEIQVLLGKHTAPSAVFALLGGLTLTSVRYNDFSYTTDPSGAANIELSGVADTFSSVALQSDQFGASKHLSNVVFSGITVNSTGQVDFSVAATVSPAALSYAKQILEGPAQPAPEAAPEEQAQPPAATSSSETPEPPAAPPADEPPPVPDPEPLP